MSKRNELKEVKEGKGVLDDLIAGLDLLDFGSRGKMMRTDWSDLFANAAPHQFFSALEKCAYSDRFSVTVKYLKDKRAVFDGWTKKEWLALLDLLSYGDRLTILLMAMENLPGAHIDKSCIEKLSSADRPEATREIIRYQNMQRLKHLQRRPPPPRQVEVDRFGFAADSEPLLLQALEVAEQSAAIGQAVLEQYRAIRAAANDMTLDFDLRQIADAPNREGKAPFAAAVDAKLTIENPSGIKEVGDASDPSSACQACLEKKAHVLCLPCAHLAICMVCVAKLKKNACIKCGLHATKWIISS